MPMAPGGALLAASATPVLHNCAGDGRFLPGTLLAGRYRIVALLGKGGMGEVYRATDLKLHQQVALKFLPESTASRPGALARFHNEARIARQLAHPNICRVYDIGESDSLHFISMEYVDGEDLASLLRRIGRLPHDKAVEIARKLCFGVAAAHESGILHRDLKPANVMLDGRGRVRITDFGLAAVADQLRREDVRSGTPAYMAPEQLAGKEVTPKSDIYALGLVLYEVFTGNRAFGAGTTRDLSPRAPSSLVTDIDTSADRVILQCLEPDPNDRPYSAMAVAAALPGGDPLAAALAAGETPSPEMVALAGGKDHLRLRTAVVCLAGVMAGLVMAALVGSKVDLIERAHLGKPPEVLAQNAAEWLARLGYQETPRDRVYGFDYANDVLRFFEEKRIPWPPLTQAGVGAVRPSPVVFWYRQSPQALNAGFSFVPGTVTRNDPPPTTPGMATVVLDPLGRLVSFSAVPPLREDDEAATVTPDLGVLFAAAGIDSHRFTAARPKRIPRSAFDARSAWTGSYPESPDIPLRLEAAYWRSKLVSLETTGPWSGVAAERRQEPGGGVRIVQVLETFVFLAMLAAGALLARRNTRLGRGDRRGAARVALFLFFAEMLVWALGANHVPEFWEMALLYMALAKAAYVAGLTWMLYLALEPYVRREWPRTLISWNRVISGRIGDSLAGAHVLIGSVVGTFVTLLQEITILANHGARASTEFGAFSLPVLLGGRHAASQLLYFVDYAVANSMAFLFVLLVLRLMLRNAIAATAASVFVFTMIIVGTGGGNPALNGFSVALGATILILMLMRYGLLALASGVFVYSVLTGFPVTTDLASWYAGTSFLAALVVLALAGIAFRAATRGQTRFSDGAA
ncbi:MAG TPA: serine/threonine-protein kinase [Bryobacteraceae bacterium]|jgi:serine/threonine-protein kinase|nr:serine/threonine-protein kinase [Bryobacteraceae bacterium]